MTAEEFKDNWEKECQGPYHDTTHEETVWLMEQYAQHVTSEKDKEIEVERQTLKALVKKGNDRWNALQAELQQLKEENERLKNDQMLICDRYTIKNHPDLPDGQKVIWIENEQGEGMTVDINKLFNDSF